MKIQAVLKDNQLISEEITDKKTVDNLQNLRKMFKMNHEQIKEVRFIYE